jgi:Xaa-Pro dipeptidase
MPVSPPFFPDQEYKQRLERVQNSLEEQNLDGLLVSTPENIYYLSGLNHQGFFAYHMLIVPRKGEMFMIARAMEKVTMGIQLNNACFRGFVDNADQSAFTIEVLNEAGLNIGRLGLEKNGLYLPTRISECLSAGMPGVQWIDASDLVSNIRAAQSPNELEYTRKAAQVSDKMLEAAIQAATCGVREQDVAAEVMKAWVQAGGEYPGFGPFIRSTPTLGEEHGTWTDRVLERGDALFLEMSGCIARYHAPIGRVFYIGEAPAGTAAIERVTLDALYSVINTIRPGIRAFEVYNAWQAEVDRAGLSHYRRHHCGYMTGIGFPPSWSGPGVPVGLRHESPMELRTGMVFHLLSWLMGTGRGDYFVSNTIIVTENGCDLLTNFPQTLQIL